MDARALPVCSTIAVTSALSVVAPHAAAAKPWGITWTVSTTCVNPTDCTRTVASDAGWSAPIYARSGIWYVNLRPL
jgi:hypothetical protein